MLLYLLNACDNAGCVHARIPLHHGLSRGAWRCQAAPVPFVRSLLILDASSVGLKVRGATGRSVMGTIVELTLQFRLYAFQPIVRFSWCKCQRS